MTRVGVVWDLVRGRAPSADEATIEGAVRRVDDASITVLLVGVFGLLQLVLDLLDTSRHHRDVFGSVEGGVVLVVALAGLAVRRRALATARRIGHPPRRTWT